MMTSYKSITKHNICAHLDLTTPNTKNYTEIITFLRHSRIFAAISTVHIPYRSHQQDFWESASIDCEVEPLVIRGKFLGHDVIVSTVHLRRLCGFQDTADQPYLLDRYLVRGYFMSAGVSGSIAAEEEVDIDSLLDLDFMSTSFSTVTTPLDTTMMTSTAAESESDDSSDDDGEAGADQGVSSDSEDTPDDHPFHIRDPFQEIQ
ncbi:hypothetical protein R6Q57_001981 [Mikania cordata]